MINKLPAAVALLFFFLATAQAKVLTLYSDSGIPPGSAVNTWNGAPAVFAGTDTTQSNPPEGYQTFLTQGSSWAGWDVIYPSAMDFSGYRNGELRFWLYTNTPDMILEIQHASGSQDAFDLSSVSSFLNQWVLVALPMNINSFSTGQPIVLTDIVSPFQITANSAGTFYVDDVRLVDQTGTDFKVSVNNISNGTSASNITWNTALPANWTRADQYINLEIDPDNQQTWGLQIYTNNTSPGANPTFTTTVSRGQPGSDPAGLISFSNPNQAIPMAWSVKAGTLTAVAVAPPMAEPNNNGLNGHPSDPNAFQWLYMKDAQTPTISALGTTAFTNADPFVTVKNDYGIHYVQGPEVNNIPSEFGASDPPNYIFLEANFGNAVSGNYQTNTLTVEFFTP